MKTSHTAHRSDLLQHNTQPLFLWLLSCAGLVFTMVIVGAVTRLTDSGLSMVEWRPLIGALPPLSHEEWMRVFELYKASPEFRQENFWMSLSDFKGIFFWEWAHRFLGRFIGLAYGAPLAWFWLRGRIPAGFKLPLLGLLFLGAAQGYMGWYMVKSGLVDMPAVSHYRLAAHLGLAFAIFAGLIKVALSLKPLPLRCFTVPQGLIVHLWVLVAAYIATVFWGAYTAGLDAGLLYNDTFPKMGDYWLPYEFNQFSPFYLNLFENHAMVQFIHRWLAMGTTLLGIGLVAHGLYRRIYSPALLALGLAFVAQMTLGVATLFSHVNIVLATLHQSGALIILGLLVVNLHVHKTRP